MDVIVGREIKVGDVFGGELGLLIVTTKGEKPTPLGVGWIA